MRRYLGTAYNIGNQRLQAVADPTAATDGVNLQTAQRLVAGITSRKEAVRAASTTNINLASPGATIDGVTLTTGDRVLLKDQTTGSENGIYDFNGSGSALTRSGDADISSEVKPGTQVFVSEGTVNGNLNYQIITDGPIVLGTTALTWTSSSGGSNYTAGNGLALTGNSFAVNPATNGGLAVAAGGVSISAGAGISVGASGVAIASSAAGNGLTITSGVLSVGAGTGISVATDTVAIDTSVVPRKFATNIGTGALTVIPVVHNLGTKDITYSIQDTNTGEFVDTDATATDTNTLTLTFATAPASGAYRVVVHG